MKRDKLVFAVFCFFFLPLLTHAGGNTLSRIDSSDPAFRGMDGRLRAIAANPELLAKLDQRHLYRTPEAYQKVLDRSLHAISALIPAGLPSGSVSNLVTAFCVYDAKVFFWVPHFDQDLVGWVSLSARDGTSKTNRMLVYWVVPHKESLKGVQWGKHQEISDHQLSETISENTGKMLDNLKNESGDTTRRNISGTMKSQNNTYLIQATLSSKCLQVRMSMAPDDNARFPGKPVLEDEPLDLAKPITLPFWPPKED